MHQVRDIGLAVALAVFPAVADAEPVVLNCTVDGFSNVFQLVVDLENKILIDGNDIKFYYPITSTTKNFITAMGPDFVFSDEFGLEHGSRAGGTIWVIERATGSLFKASVGGACSNGGDCELGAFNALSQSGQCKKQVF